PFVPPDPLGGLVQDGAAFGDMNVSAFSSRKGLALPSVVGSFLNREIRFTAAGFVSRDGGGQRRPWTTSSSTAAARSRKTPRRPGCRTQLWTAPGPSPSPRVRCPVCPRLESKRAKSAFAGVAEPAQSESTDNSTKVPKIKCRSNDTADIA